MALVPFVYINVGITSYYCTTLMGRSQDGRYSGARKEELARDLPGRRDRNGIEMLGRMAQQV